MTDIIRYRPERKLDAAILGIVITIGIQAGATVWWAATVDSRVHHLEDAVAAIQSVPADIRVINSRVESLTLSVDRIENKLDKHLDAIEQSRFRR